MESFVNQGYWKRACQIGIFGIKLGAYLMKNNIFDQNQILFNLPKPSENRIAIRVASAAQKSINRGHPWVYESAITHQNREGEMGDLAVLFDQNRNFLAVGLYDPSSMIRVRVLQFRNQAQISEDWFAQKLVEAAQIRNPLLSTDTTGYRLVYGENDGLPGLVIDCYAGTLVIKLYTATWLPYLTWILAGLNKIMSFERVVLRFSRMIKDEIETSTDLKDGMILWGKPLSGPVLFHENGLVFESEPVFGQKTGFFLDQRNNRAQVEKLSAGRSVLNVFAYTGGFSVYAGRGGASRVVSVDLSRPAIEAAKRNWEHNLDFLAVQKAHHQGIVGDAFQVLSEMAAQHTRFDMVILDPPMFAHKQDQIDGAVAAYKRLTLLGLGVLKPGGILVQASCSSRVSADQFYELIHSTVNHQGYEFEEIHRSQHALDHPVKIPEGSYLKCVFGKIK